MNRKFITAAFFASVTFVPAVLAENGTINFVGEVLPEACVVDTNSQNLTVTLGKISASAFTGPGSTAAPTNFQLILKDCPVTANKAVVKFDGISVKGDNSMIALTSGANTAQGVAIQLSDATQKVVNLLESSQPYTLATGLGVTNKLDFSARYIALSSDITPGAANATSQFTIVYQ
jgi:major type 1 subunit fimbrin (pilin)